MKKISSGKVKNRRKLFVRSKMLWVSLSVAVSFWFIEAVIHVIVFKQGTYYEQMVFPHSHEFWMRSLVMAMFILFGVYAQVIINSRKRM
ncbi:MAG: FUSC family protein [Candidatus Omnitrophica bacterium]|nr:FUSC family protein [Candidatus Omnitrophota bacterium]